MRTNDIFQDYGKLVYRYLLRLCGDKDLAEELMQETFYQAVKSADRFDGSCKVSTWLCQIAKHMWYRELRKKKHDIVPLADMELTADFDVEQDFLRKASALAVLKQVHRLPEYEKEVILLRAAGGMSFREIGEVMGKTENWARVTFFRAKQRIKEEG